MFGNCTPGSAVGRWQTILAASEGRQVRTAAVGETASGGLRLLVLALLLLLPLSNGMQLGAVRIPYPNGSQPRAVRIPFRTAQSMILVDGKVNGNPATLLLDTGADRTIISRKAYGSVQFRLQQLRRNSHGAGVSGGSIPLRADLVIADHMWPAQRVSVMELDELNDMLKLHFDGLLGQDILRQFRSVRIDYHTKMIELEE